MSINVKFWFYLHPTFIKVTLEWTANLRLSCFALCFAMHSCQKCLHIFLFCLLLFFCMAQPPFQRTNSSNWWTVGSRVRPKTHSKPPLLFSRTPPSFIHLSSLLFLHIYVNWIYICARQCQPEGLPGESHFFWYEPFFWINAASNGVLMLAGLFSVSIC